VGLAHTDGPVEDHRLPGLDEAAGGQVADLGDGELGVEAKVELLQGGRLLEAGAADAAAQCAGLAAGDLVLAQHLEELQVAQFAGVGLGQALVEGLQHAAELEGPQGAFELMELGHRATP
jgi:hypothetical protein